MFGKLSFAKTKATQPLVVVDEQNTFVELHRPHFPTMATPEVQNAAFSLQVSEIVRSNSWPRHFKPWPATSHQLEFGVP